MPDELKPLWQTWEDNKRRLWLMSPDLARTTAGPLQWDMSASRNFIKPILRNLITKRTYSSYITLRDGSREFLGSGIPTSTVMMEVAHGFDVGPGVTTRSFTIETRRQL